MMYSLGIDTGSVSTDFVLMDENRKIADSLYLRTHGDPAGALARGMAVLKEKYRDQDIFAVGATGSGRVLAGHILGADVIKNEITAHGVAASMLDPDVRTVLEIGGQDSKIILLENGVIRDFAMNTVCAAGTGAFLDRQAERMNMTIEEFSTLGLKSSRPERIAGRCAVFAESDIIHRQQQGAAREDIIAGVAESLVRNYLGNVARGKKIRGKVFFQGGVSSNQTILKAFERELGCSVIVPEYNKVMGAFGAAVLAAEAMEQKIKKGAASTCFRGFDADYGSVRTRTFQCSDCANSCEVTEILSGSGGMGCFSDRCGKYQNAVCNVSEEFSSDLN